MFSRGRLGWVSKLQVAHCMRVLNGATPHFRDIFMVIKYPQLLPINHDAAASYTAPQPRLLPQACDIKDVCDFVVRYIHSNVLVSK
jgi:hypothetical protein